MNVLHIKKVFTKYVKTFNIKDIRIYYKWKHSFRVMKNSKQIARWLKLSKRDVLLATIIGLLHDVGRFEQWDKYHTFSDTNSEDHSDIGIRVLFEDDEISKYNINPEFYKTIKLAILYHNDREIDLNAFKQENGELDENALMHAKIIRDADKLDIFKSFEKMEHSVFKYKDEDVNPLVMKEFSQFKSVTITHIKTLIDRTLCLLAMPFDLNYTFSRKKTLKMKYHNKIYKFFNPQLNNQNQELLTSCVSGYEKYMN